MRKTKLNYYLILLCLAGFYAIFVAIRSISGSLFFSHPERINILYYGDSIKLVSIGLVDSIDYELYFDAEKRILVPGGYGRYRIGALGKLAQIEKKPELVTRSFSSVLSANVQYTFGPLSSIPIFDRLYLYFLLTKQKKSDFINLNTSYVDPAHTADFSESSFQKKYKGFFYEKKLRNEGKNISIQYKIYSSVKTVSRIIEGQGIRVVDVSYTPNPGSVCYIIESGKPSASSHYLASTFGCSIRQGTVSGADIQLVLGEKLEREWE